MLENKRQVEVRRHFPSVARVRYMETIAIYEQAWGKHDDSQEVGWGRHMEERSRQLAKRSGGCHRAQVPTTRTNAHTRWPHAYEFSYVYIVATNHTLNWERTMCPASRDATSGRDVQGAARRFVFV